MLASFIFLGGVTITPRVYAQGAIDLDADSPKSGGGKAAGKGKKGKNVEHRSR